MTDQACSVPSSVLTAAGLVGGYAVARATGVRALGGVTLAAAGIAAGRTWARAGIPQTAVLSVTYIAAFGLSHPLAKKMLAMASANKDDPALADYVELVFDQALVAEGSPVKNPAKFSKMVTDLLAKA